MKILRASDMGMCFGVRDALRTARDVRDPESVTIYGELVHNGEVLRELDQRGFRMIPEPGRNGPPDGGRILITAHGISNRQRASFETSGKQLLDTTCPLVRHVQQSARELADEGRLVLIIGKPGHVEVEGIIGDLEKYEVVPDEHCVRCYPVQRLGIVSQSTTPPDRQQRVLAAIRRQNAYRDIRHIDTICFPTRARQEAVRRLLDAVEAVVVVGGARSNNTRELVDLAHSSGVPALHVQTAQDLDPLWISRFSVLGLTAGTSALDRDIDAVERAIVALAVPAGRAAIP